MPLQLNVNARSFTPTPPPPPPSRLHPLPTEESPSPSPATKKKTRHQRHDRASKREKYLAAGQQPPPRHRKSRKVATDLPLTSLTAQNRRSRDRQHDLIDPNVQEEEEMGRPPSRSLTWTVSSVFTDQSALKMNIWQRSLKDQHPRAWTSVSGVGYGQDWGTAKGQGYGGVMHTWLRPITRKETTASWVVGKVYERKEWSG